MAQNPYAPPAAPVADRDEPRYDAQPMFFPVAIWKLLLMLVFTLGLYEIYWQDRNWKLVRDRDGSDIQPVWRAIFAIFFVYALFKRMREDGAAHGINRIFHPGFLTVIYVFARIAWNARSVVATLGLLGFVVLATAQAQATAVNDAASPGYDPNNRLSGWNVVALAVPIAIVLLISVSYLFFGNID